nr:hypothetical protein CFP56_62507 [Quercus suber]
MQKGETRMYGSHRAPIVGDQQRTPLEKRNLPCKTIYKGVEKDSSPQTLQLHDKVLTILPRLPQSKCRHDREILQRAAPSGLDARIERALTALLSGEDVEEPITASSTEDQDATAAAAAAAGPKPATSVARPRASKKGDPRLVVKLSEVETAVFGDRRDPAKTAGRKKNRLPRGVREAEGEWRSVDMLDSDDERRHHLHQQQQQGDSDEAGGVSDVSLSETEEGGVRLVDDHVRLPQSRSDVDFSVGGERGWAEKICETPEMLAKRREGQKRADEKEMVKKVARRAVVFGLWVDASARADEGRGGGKKAGKKAKERGEEQPHGEKVRRKCEALMQGQVVEPSFAKGDWEIRWREGFE